MPLEITVDAAAVQAMIRTLPGLAAKGVKKGVTLFGLQTIREFRKARLNAPNDAVQTASGLAVRPVASQGLVRRSGTLAEALTYQINGQTLNSIVLSMFFLGALQQRIARIQELGTVGKGGSMPDIIPVSKRFLAVPIGGGRVVFLKKVAIPPRLGFRTFMAAALNSGRLERYVATAVGESISGSAA